MSMIGYIISISPSIGQSTILLWELKKMPVVGYYHADGIDTNDTSVQF